MNCSEKLIIALDFPSGHEALDWVRKLTSTVRYFKVGKQLFVSEGPKIVRDIRELGGEVFLDLKFHDIPNTVFSATRAAMELEPFMLNVHVLGGTEMMKAARAAVDQFHKKGKRPLLIGVTLLTSHSDESLSELRINQMSSRTPVMSSRTRRVRDLVIQYATLAAKAGLDGVVCSAGEVADIKKVVGEKFITVTPGIRFSGEECHSRGKCHSRGSGNPDDQKRIATVEEALQSGADYLVLGRSLFNSKDPLERLGALIG